MELCLFCDFKVETNRYGQLNKHVQKVHQMKWSDYIIAKDHGGVAPMCECGWCNEPPHFTKRGFSKFAWKHNTHEFRRRKYIEKFGEPECHFCGAPSGFDGAEPQKFCSVACWNNISGHMLQSVENRVKAKEAFIDKYGVENPFQIDFVREAISNQQKDLWMQGKSNLHQDDWSEKVSLAMKERWQDSEFREKMLEVFKETQARDEVRVARSKIQKKKIADDPDYMPNLRRKALGKMRNRFSKLHLKVIDKLKLREIGFIGEQILLGRYIVDEFHADKKIVVEINGDYAHANPKYYCANDLITLPGQKKLASVLWEHDTTKISALEKEGYRVVVIWESDNWKDKLEEIKKLMF